jgi:GT2 family glycosyltransferase/2-polyprenyl-3-methyl-5-hydroxy-6-metoxy-1,4-benzoquinol methylase
VRGDALTVVIPTRERWEVLGRTLDALGAQTVTGFETLVVCDGADQHPPPELRERPGVRFAGQEHAGPGAARNRGVDESRRPLLLFLGDDMIPSETLLERHLARHDDDPAPEAAVLGHVDWHREVARGHLNRWLDWSGSQFDYRQLRTEAGPQAGWGRFYSCNVSLKRELFLRAGGFDPEFRFDYEDLDLAWRLHAEGMRLLYEPGAVAYHLHRHDWESVQRRYESRARAERLMLAKHDWFAPWFYNRIRSHDSQPGVSPLWAALARVLPARPAWARTRVEARADRWYHQRLAPRFLSAWEAQRELEELQRYLGSYYEHEKLVHHRRSVDREAAASPDEPTFYRTSQAYLYDLTAFAMSGTKDPYHRVLRSLVPAGARLLDYGCGIGSDCLRLLEAGYHVAFADFDSPSIRYLRWRLQRRQLTADVFDVDHEVPGGFDAAYAFDVIEHVEDPLAFLDALERRARIVVVNLLEPEADDTPLHRPLPISTILSHARERGLLRHERFHGRSQLVAYRSSGGS